MHEHLPYYWLQHDKAFRREYHKQEPLRRYRMERELERIADGSRETKNSAPVNAILARLRALAPKDYGAQTQRVELTGRGGRPIQVQDGTASRALEFAARVLAASVAQPQQIEHRAPQP